MKVLYLVTEDWYFWSHRLALARAAKQRGHEVVVVTAVNKHGERIKEEGFKLVPWTLDRSGKNPLRELGSVWELVAVYRRYRPDVAHHVALKPVLYGAVASAVAKTPVTVNALAGLGHIFVAKGPRAFLARKMMTAVLRLAMRREKSGAIFQNPDDMNRFVDAGIVHSEKASLIKGSGVDTDIFVPPATEPSGVPIVLLHSRMLKTKGVYDFLEAAKLLKGRMPVRMVLAGAPDPHNPASVTLPTLEEWNKQGHVEYWGQKENMPEIIKRSSVVALPSFYGEGVPRSLIEAASAARPVVAYDIAGCREIVRDRVNGFLAPAGDVEALAGNIERLLVDDDLRTRMGAEGRRIVEKEFGVRRVAGETLDLYEKLMS